MSSEKVDELSATVSAPLPIAAESSGSVLAEDGPVLAGRYKLLGLLGTGGMGSVYRARDLELDEVVALKMLRRDAVAAPGTLARFRQEVKLARRVTHKNVARTFDIGEHESERFLTMEYLEGVALSRVIEDGGTNATRALRIAREIAEGLHAAHEAGVVHLDLKPENVMMSPTGRVVITDFGIARLGGASGSARAEWVGTPAYMAPEQVEGRSDLDARCDLYALGEVLYELLTGRLAWPGDNPIACAAARLLRDPPSPRAVRADVPAPVDELVLRLLARKREERIASAAEVIHAIDAIDPRGRSTLAPIAQPSANVATTHHRRDITVAVLPFTNEGVEDDYLSDGVGDDLLDTLSTTPALRVRPRSMVARFKGSSLDGRTMGRELGVDVVVEGKLRRLAPETFRLVIRALSVADGFQLWAKRFDVRTAQLLVTSDAAARAIAEALTARIALPTRKAGTDPVAVDLYLRAREELRRRGYGNDVDDAIPLLEEALRREPDDPHCLSAYAIARSRVTQSRESLALAEASAERATTLAPHLAESWRALAVVRMMSGDFGGTIHACARALECSPHLAEAHHLLADIMYQVGWLDSAIQRATLALSHDPFLRGPAITLSVIHALRGDYARAEAMLLDRSLAEPPVKYIALGTHCRLAIWRRNVPVAIEEIPDLGIAATKLSRVLQSWATGEKDPSVLEWLRIARVHTSPMIASFMGQVDAEISAFDGHREAVFAALAFADERGLIDLAWVDRLPLFADVRADARFEALRKRVAARAQAIAQILAESGFAPTPARATSDAEPTS